MNLRALTARVVRHEGLNFVLTNRILRRWLTRVMGRLSKVEVPLVRDLSILAWEQFAELDLSDAKKARAEFRSLHECFTRELRPGARRVDPDPGVLASPCDGIIGACGRIENGRLVQAKGRDYTLQELLLDADLAAAYEGGCYVTLRLTSAMYHRFHAPHDCRVEQVEHVPGDVWNVNPAALARVDRLFCRNERAVLRCRLDAGGQLVTLVPVAAVLVAAIRLHFLDLLLHLDHRGPQRIACDAPLARGQEMGWFEHGSTIIVFAPAGFRLCEAITGGTTVRMGQALLRLP